VGARLRKGDWVLEREVEAEAAEERVDVGLGEVPEEKVAVGAAELLAAFTTGIEPNSRPGSSKGREGRLPQAAERGEKCRLKRNNNVVVPLRCVSRMATHTPPWRGEEKIGKSFTYSYEF
jgi:hypothetical protein